MLIWSLFISFLLANHWREFFVHQLMIFGYFWFILRIGHIDLRSQRRFEDTVFNGLLPKCYNSRTRYYFLFFEPLKLCAITYLKRNRSNFQNVYLFPQLWTELLHLSLKNSNTYCNFEEGESVVGDTIFMRIQVKMMSFKKLRKLEYS